MVREFHTNILKPKRLTFDEKTLYSQNFRNITQDATCDVSTNSQTQKLKNLRTHKLKQLINLNNLKT